MITLIDTFNDREISRHRTARAAVRAQLAHARAVRRNNGAGSYIPTKIVDADGEPVDERELRRIEYAEAQQ